jgi:glycosyltransferase 2 family protein
MIILFAVIVYLLMAIYADFGNLLSALEKFDWIFLPLMLILTTIGYLFRFLKWNFFLKKVDVRLNLKDNLFVFFSGLSMIITPAKVGEIWKAWLIRDINGESISKTIPVVVIDRVTDLLGLIILSLLGILYYRDSVYIIVLLLIVFAAFFVSIRSGAVSNRIISILEKRAGKYSGDIKTMHGTFEKTMEPGTLIGMSFLSAFAWFFECLALYFVVYGFGEFIGIVLSTFIFSFASLAGAVSMIPGGLGVAEATISGMLQLFGLNPAIAIGTAIIVRFGTLWYGAILGFSVYFIFRNRIEKYKNQESENVRYEI